MALTRAAARAVVARQTDAEAQAVAFQVVTGGEAEWLPREPLPPLLPPVSPLSASILPFSLAPWSEDIAYRTNAPFDFSGVCTLVAAGGVIARRAGMRPKQNDDWVIPCNLQGGIVGPPAIMKKSPVLGQVLRPIDRLEAKAREEFALASAVGTVERDTRDALRKIAKADHEKALKSGTEDVKRKAKAAAIAAEQEAAAPIPQERRYTVGDATIEKIGELLIANPSGLLSVWDELTGLLRSLDRQDRPADRAFFLTAADGVKSFRVDRIGRGSLNIPALCLSVIGGIQPGPLQRWVSEAIDPSTPTGADGLLQRLQVVTWPDPPTSWEWRDEKPNAGARAEADIVFERLANLRPEDFGAEGVTDGGIPYIGWAPDALELYRAWDTSLQNRLHRPELRSTPAFASHIAKYEGLVPRIALVLHLCDVVTGRASGPVSLAAAKAAAAWATYLEDHARRIYSPELRGAVTGAHALADRISGGKVTHGMDVRDIQRREYPQLATANALYGAIDELERHGWVRLAQRDPRDSPEGQPQGRRASVLLLHPELRGLAK